MDKLYDKLHQMKKALDYVSDYRLESACEDAPRIALSRVTEKIFVVLVDLYHCIVLTLSFKLLSFFTYIRNMDGH